MVKKYPDKSDIINIGISNEKNTKKNRQSILPFPADRGAGKCTFTSFLQETGRKICGKSEKDRIYIRDSRRLKNHSRRQSGMHFGYVTENGVNSNVYVT